MRRMKLECDLDHNTVRKIKEKFLMSKSKFAGIAVISTLTIDTYETEKGANNKRRYTESTDRGVL